MGMHVCTVYSLWPRHTLHTRHPRRPLPSLVAILAPGPAGPTLPWDSEGTAGPRWSHESWRADRTQGSLYTLRQSRREREREDRTVTRVLWQGAGTTCPSIGQALQHSGTRKKGETLPPFVILRASEAINQSGSTLPSDHDGSSLLQPRPDSSSAVRQ